MHILPWCSLNFQVSYLVLSWTVSSPLFLMASDEKTKEINWKWGKYVWVSCGLPSKDFNLSWVVILMSMMLMLMMMMMMMMMLMNVMIKMKATMVMMMMMMMMWKFYTCGNMNIRDMSYLDVRTGKLHVVWFADGLTEECFNDAPTFVMAADDLKVVTKAELRHREVITIFDTSVGEQIFRRTFLFKYSHTVFDKPFMSRHFILSFVWRFYGRGVWRHHSN